MPVEMTPPGAVDQAVSDILSATPEGMVVGVQREKHAAKPSDTSMGNVVYNPQLERGAECPARTGGCSTVVTPTPTFLPKLEGVDWVVGILGAILAAVRQDGWKQRHDLWTDRVRETIDHNNYLPQTYDDMRDWRTLSGTQTS